MVLLGIIQLYSAESDPEYSNFKNGTYHGGPMMPPRRSATWISPRASTKQRWWPSHPDD